LTLLQFKKCIPTPKNKLFLDNILTKLDIFRYIFVLSVSVGFLSLINNDI
jgi:hypothetical protein